MALLSRFLDMPCLQRHRLARAATLKLTMKSWFIDRVWIVLCEVVFRSLIARFFRYDTTSLNNVNGPFFILKKRLTTLCIGL